ncbi:MAG: FG-GAP repeat protein, partial [Nanoarchaeota archaeon]|nr:FG-GAP repeat protein [Nanoarchaeota archaeon]
MKKIILMIFVIGIMMLFPTLVSAGISEIAKIMADDNKTNDYFGYSVSISSDGNSAIFGSPYANDNDIMVGVGYIFRWNGTTWTQQTKILASDKELSDYFGQSVSISSDGNTAIIGAYREDDGGSMAGAAYIFRWNGTTWTQQAKIMAGDAQASDYFGYSVSISSDGSSAIVGAYNEDTGGSNAGAAYIFQSTASSQLPTYTTFTSVETTNFSSVNLTSVPNLTLAINGKGKIRFPSDHNINTENEDYDTNIDIGDAVIYVNSAALDSSFNNSATLTFYSVDCSMPYVYFSEIASTRSAILLENNLCFPPRCTNIQCSAGTLTVDVIHFSGYAVNGTANLTIDADDPKYPLE